MGKSKTLAQMQKDNEEFAKFMGDLSDKSNALEAQLTADIEKTVKDFYGNNKWDGKYFFGNKNSDYQLYSEWSLDSVNKIIQSIAAAIKSQQFPSPAVPGSENAPKSTTDEVKQFISNFQLDYNLILQRVLNVITSFITQFASITSVSQKKVQQDFYLSGGLHLFLGQCGSVYQSKSIFTNSFIGSFQVVFQCHMSVSEAEFVSLQDILKTTAAEIQATDTLITDINATMVTTLNEILNAKPLIPELYLNTVDTFDKMKKNVRDKRDALQEEYSKYKRVTDIIDSNLARIKSKEIVLDKVLSQWESSIAERYINELN
ncbi:hypothetical protein [Kluyvera intermedia]|uniref:hypothetical protein n=1 Tax=Kluyvera intermedia TaxID=61648 RepID=UPI00372D2FD2